MSYFILIQSEIIMTLRQASSWMTPLLFFVIVVCFFPLALGPDSELLQTIAPSIIWVAAMLAMIISTGNIFRNDMEDGFLDILLLSQCSLTLLTLCKIFSHWLTHALPLIIISPLLAFLLHWPLLLPILIMPFYIPVLIFGTGTIQIAATHQPVIAYYAIMAAILLITLAFAPLFTGMALKIGVNQ
jgi:heme exporter protein B